MSKKLIRLLRSLLPGFFLVGLTIGTGSVTAMVKAGADHGSSLLWAIFLSCIVAYILLDAFGRLTIYSGKTALHAIRTYIHPSVACLLLGALAINVSGSVMGVMGIMSDVLAEWSHTWGGSGVTPIVWALGLSALIIVVLFNGSVRALEVLLAVLAGIMGVCFLVNAATMMPPVGEIMAGMIPSIPTSTGASGKDSGYLVAASMVGTTVAPIVLMMRSIVVHEQGWTPADLISQRRDAAVSAVLIFVISGSIMVSAAGSLHESGVGLDHVRQMIPLLEPIAGSFGIVVFVFGLAAAGLSSQFPNVVFVPWLLHDYRGEAAQVHGLTDKVILVVMCLIGLVVPIFHASPVWVMLISQVVGTLILPTTILCLAYLLNREEVMGEHKNSAGENCILGLVALFSLVMAGVGLWALFA